MTFDNGFLTDRSRENIREVTARLKADSLIIAPAFPNLASIFTLAAEKELFPKKALERASSVCTACIGLVKAAAYREAILRQIPFVCFGWTPGPGACQVARPEAGEPHAPGRPEPAPDPHRQQPR